MSRRAPKDLEKAQETRRRVRAEVETTERTDAKDPIYAAAEAKVENALQHLPARDRKKPLMRAATKLALMFGEPPPKSIKEVELERARGYIMMAERSYARDGNPMHVFRAYLLARHLGDPLPHWVLNYLDQSISGFWSAYEAFVLGEDEAEPVTRQKNDPAESLATTFSVRRGKGARTIWDQTFYDSSRSEVFGEAVITLAEQKSKKGSRFDLSGLLDEARAEFSKSRSAAWKAWNRYEDTFPREVLALKQLPGFRSAHRRER